MIEAYLIVGFVLWTFVIAQFDLIRLNKTGIILSAGLRAHRTASAMNYGTSPYKNRFTKN